MKGSPRSSPQVGICPTGEKKKKGGGRKVTTPPSIGGPNFVIAEIAPPEYGRLLLKQGRKKKGLSQAQKGATVTKMKGGGVPTPNPWVKKTRGEG